MTPKQTAAIRRLEKTLAHCHKNGLMGGVFDGAFCVWPLGTEPHPQDSENFFRAVEKCGVILSADLMCLDGGSGV